MDKEARFIELLVKRHSDNLSIREWRELHELLNDDVYKYRMEQMLGHIMDVPVNSQSYLDNKDILPHVDNIFRKISTLESPISEYKEKKFSWIMYAVAASVLLLLAIPLFFIINKNSKKAQPNLIVTKKASKSNLILPDGTTVWVNADTKIKYEGDFGKTSRDIYLNGEAYFEVVPNKDIPFIVHTRLMDLRVLGTGFNVKAYEKDAISEATLIHGSIEVLLKNGLDKKIILKPNEKIAIQDTASPSENRQLKITNEEGGNFSVSKSPKSESLQNIAWISNKLIFRKEKLTDLIPVLERWYNMHIIFKDDGKGDIEVTGTFENDSIEDVLQSLQLSTGIQYTVRKDSVLIY